MKKLLALSFLVFLTACGGPIYDTEYELVAPKSRQGKACVERCGFVEQGCSQSCRTQAYVCQTNPRFYGGVGFGHHRGWRRGYGSGIGFSSPGYYENYCPSPNFCIDQCLQQHNSCYMACGGKVIPHTVCVSGDCGQ